MHLVVWSRVENRWTNLLFSAGPRSQLPPGAEDDVEVLVAVDGEFRRLLGDDQSSPFAFKLAATTPMTPAAPRRHPARPRAPRWWFCPAADADSVADHRHWLQHCRSARRRRHPTRRG
jgi:hypothetical protein